MYRTPVKSSDLRSVGYDKDQWLLEIEFHDGRVYQYSNVPSLVYEELMSAPSHGIYFSRHIKKAPYPCVRVL